LNSGSFKNISRKRGKGNGDFMYSIRYQGELNRDAAEEWLRKYSELFSCFTVEGPTGLKARLSAFMSTENHGTAELNKLAETSLTEKQWLARLEVDPDAPNDDSIYMALFQRLASQAFLRLVERGVIEEIKLVEEFPPIAQQQYDTLVAEARAVSERKLSPAEHKSAADADLKAFADQYSRERVDNLRPRGGFVTLAGQMVAWSDFQNKFNAAVVAGYIR
jgi:hypothetical protein